MICSSLYLAFAVLSHVAGSQSRSLSGRRTSLRKRTVTYDDSCNAHPEVAQGIADATSLAQNAARVLSDATNPNNPFVGGGNPWDALREALFGGEQVSSTADIICMATSVHLAGFIVNIVPDKVSQQCTTTSPAIPMLEYTAASPMLILMFVTRASKSC